MTLILVTILVAVLAIQLKGLSINQVREKFRCALRRRRTAAQITRSTTTTTVAPTTTTDFPELYKLKQECTGRDQPDVLYPAFTIQSKN